MCSVCCVPSGGKVKTKSVCVPSVEKQGPGSGRGSSRRVSDSERSSCPAVYGKHMRQRFHEKAGSSPYCRTSRAAVSSSASGSKQEFHTALLLSFMGYSRPSTRRTAFRSSVSGFSASICSCCAGEKRSMSSFSGDRFHLSAKRRIASGSTRRHRSITIPSAHRYTAGTYSGCPAHMNRRCTFSGLPGCLSLPLPHKLP